MTHAARKPETSERSRYVRNTGPIFNNVCKLLLIIIIYCKKQIRFRNLYTAFVNTYRQV